jgi:hypothetical protein
VIHPILSPGSASALLHPDSETALLYMSAALGRRVLLAMLVLPTSFLLLPLCVPLVVLASPASFVPPASSSSMRYISSLNSQHPALWHREMRYSQSGLDSMAPVGLWGKLTTTRRVEGVIRACETNNRRLQSHSFTADT